jgi:hypothetical protein
MEAHVRRIARGALLAVLAPGINGCGGYHDESNASNNPQSRGVGSVIVTVRDPLLVPAANVAIRVNRGWADGDRDARSDDFDRAEIHDVPARGLDAGASQPCECTYSSVPFVVRIP